MKRVKRAKRTARPPAAEVLDPELEPPVTENVTIHPIPEVLWNPEKPDEPHHSERETVSIRVSRAVTGSGYSYLGEVVPTDLPNEKELLARFGPGRYRLDGLTTKNTFVKSRVGLCVGDFDPHPGGGVASYRLPPAAPPRSTAENVAGVVAAIMGVLVPIVTPIVSHLQSESARREQREREHTTQLMTMMQSIGTARNADLEKLLQAALANLANPPTAMSGSKAMQEMFINMLDAQRATYTDLMNTARESAGDDETLKTLIAGFSGWTEAQKADAVARLEEAKAKQAESAAAAAAPTEAANGMAAPH